MSVIRLLDKVEMSAKQGLKNRGYKRLQICTAGYKRLQFRGKTGKLFTSNGAGLMRAIGEIFADIAP